MIVTTLDEFYPVLRKARAKGAPNLEAGVRIRVNTDGQNLAPLEAVERLVGKENVKLDEQTRSVIHNAASYRAVIFDEEQAPCRASMMQIMALDDGEEEEQPPSIFDEALSNRLQVQKEKAKLSRRAPQQVEPQYA